MRYLSGDEEKQALNYINTAAKIALGSSCYRSRCGAVIVQNEQIIGSGFNMSFDAGIAEFVLWHDEGVCVYDTTKYNAISFQFRG